MKKTNFYLSILFFVMFFFACSNQKDNFLPDEPSVSSTQSISTKTQIKTNTPFVTSTTIATLTPTVTPCKIGNESFDYVWCPETVLIDYYVSLGDGGRDVPVPSSPDLILYADGKAFVVRYEEIDGRYTSKLLYKQFDRKGICQHLNTFEKIDYLNYEPSNYQFVGGDPAAIGAGSVHLKVNAWKSHEAVYYGLNYFLSFDESGYQDALATPLPDRAGYPIVDDALQNAYYFMHLYSVDEFIVYQPEKLGVWVVPLEQKYLKAYSYYSPKEWKSKIFSLNEVTEGKSSDDYPYYYIVSNESDVKEAYSQFDYSLNTFLFFEESDSLVKKYYLVASRPILPYEILDNPYRYTIPDPSSPKFSTPLGCNLNDGTLPIPTP